MSASSSSSPSARIHWPSVVGTLAVTAAAAAAFSGARRLFAAQRQRQQQQKQLQAQSAATSAVECSAAAAAANSSAAVPPSSSSAVSLLDFLLLVGRCKLEKRTGWVNEGVPMPESVADHQYRMAIMALSCIDYEALNGGNGSGSGSGSGCTCGAAGVAAASSSSDSSRISPARAVRMALVHDLAESIVGDITPSQFSGVSKERKHELEAEAMDKIVHTLRSAHRPAADQADGTVSPSPVHDISAEVLSLWREYEAGVSATARYVKNIDKIEMFIQALEYQQTAVATATPEAIARKKSLARFYNSMNEVRNKARTQDAQSGEARPQRLLCELIDELQRRIQQAQ